MSERQTMLDRTIEPTTTIPARCIPVLDWITAHPGSRVTEIAAGTGMTRHMVSDRLQILSAHGAIHARHIGKGCNAYHPGPAADRDPARTYRIAAASSRCGGRPMRVSLPPAPFAIPAVDRSETAPRGRTIRDSRMTSTRQDRVLRHALRVAQEGR